MSRDYFSKPWACPKCKAPSGKQCRFNVGDAMAGDYGPEVHVERVDDPRPGKRAEFEAFADALPPPPTTLLATRKAPRP